MPGASEQTRRVKTLNANWVAGEDGEDGRLEVMIVTEHDRLGVEFGEGATRVVLRSSAATSCPFQCGLGQPARGSPFRDIRLFFSTGILAGCDL